MVVCVLAHRGYYIVVVPGFEELARSLLLKRDHHNVVSPVGEHTHHHL